MKKLLILLVPFMVAATSPFEWTIQSSHPRLFINADCTEGGAWSSGSTYSTGDNVTHNSQTYKAKKTVPKGNTPDGFDEYWEVCRDFQDIRDDIANSTVHAEWYANVLAGANSRGSCSGLSAVDARRHIGIFENAFVYLYTGNSTYRSRAVSCADGADGSSSIRSHYGINTVLGYDWLANASNMTGAHASCSTPGSTDLGKLAKAVKDTGNYTAYGDRDTEGTSENVKFFSTAFAGAIALKGYGGDSYYNEVTVNGGWSLGALIRECFDAYAIMMDGGGAHRMGRYDSVTAHGRIILYAAASTGFTDFNLARGIYDTDILNYTWGSGEYTFGDAGREWDMPMYLLRRFSTGSGSHKWWHGDGVFEIFNNSRWVITKAGSTFITNSPYMRWWAIAQQTAVGDAAFGENTVFPVYPLIFVDYGATRTAPTVSAPGTMRHAYEQTIMRSGWSFDDDTVVLFHNGGRLDHTPTAAGAFQLYRGDNQIIMDRGYCSQNSYPRTPCYLRRTIANSGITVFRDGSEDWSARCDAYSDNDLECGCQKTTPGNSWYNPWIWERINGIKQNVYEYRTVEDTRDKDSEFYDYLWLDISPSYKTEQVTSLTRSFVLVGDFTDNDEARYLVIYDRVTAPLASNRKRVLFQTGYEPNISGTDATITGSNSITYLNTLLPSSRKLNRVSGEEITAYNGDSGATMPMQGSDYATGTWRLELEPVSANSATDNFLSILQVSKKGDAENTVTLDNTENDLDCAIIEDSADPWVVCFNDDESRLGPAATTLSLNASGLELNSTTYKYMVADMKQEHTYEISGLTGGAEFATAGADGTIYFKGVTNDAAATISIGEGTEDWEDPAKIEDVTATASTTVCKAMDIEFTHPDADTTRTDAQDCSSIECKYDTTDIDDETKYTDAEAYDGGFSIGGSGSTVSFTASSLPADATTYYWSCKCSNPENTGAVDSSPSGHSADTAASDSEACDPQTPPDKPATVTNLTLSDGSSCGGEIGFSFTVPSGTVDYCKVAVDKDNRIDSNTEHTNADKVVTFNEVVAGSSFSGTIGGLDVSTDYYGAVRCGNVDGEGTVDTSPGGNTTVTVGHINCGASACDYQSKLGDARIQGVGTIYGVSDDKNQGGRVFIDIGGRYTYKTRGLVKVDFLSSLQSAGVIDSSDISAATLYLYGDEEYSSTDRTVYVHRILKDWNEGDKDGEAAATGESTWNSAKHNVTAWSTAGVGATADADTAGNWDSVYDRGSATDCSFSYDNINKWFTCTLTTAVKDMFDDDNDYGFLFKLSDEDEGYTRYKVFATKEDGGSITPYMSFDIDTDTDKSTSSAACAVTGKSPSDITDLSAVMGPGDGEAILNFTAPQDDDAVGGTAEYYIVKYSRSGAITTANWSSATTVAQSWSPKSPDVTETRTLTGLPADTKVWLAIKSYDEDDNASGASNSVSVWAGDCVRKRCGDTSIKSFGSY